MSVLKSESRGQRILNVVIFAGMAVVASGIAVTPRNGAEGFLQDWLKSGLPILSVLLAVLVVSAPGYIRGGKA